MTARAILARLSSWCLALMLCGAAPISAAAVDFTVTRFDDPSPVACVVGSCSLREAVAAANLLPDTDSIILPAGTYTLTIAGTAEDAAATGDLDLTGDVVITGAGADVTIVQAGTVAGAGIDRVFDIRAGASSISAITVRNGFEPGTDGGAGLVNGGGGIRVRSGAALKLTDAVVAANRAAGTFATGGGIKTDGTLTVSGSTIRDNVAQNVGGGIMNIFGNMALTNVTVSGNANVDGSGGAGVVNIGFGAGLANVTITANTNGGYSNDTFATPIRNTIIAGNSAPFGGNQNCRLVNGSIDDQGYNLGPSECGFSEAANDVVTTDPGLGPLADNGGTTPTHAVLPESAALDAANPATPGSGGNACPTTDQRGVLRPQPNPDGRCDIGAFEFAPEPETTTTTSSSTTSSTSSSTSTTESTTTTSSSSSSTTTSSSTSTTETTSSTSTSSTTSTTSTSSTATSTSSSTSLPTTTSTSSSTTTSRPGRPRPTTTTSITITSTTQPGASTTSTTLRSCGSTFPACNGTCPGGRTCTTFANNCRCQ